MSDQRQSDPAAAIACPACGERELIEDRVNQRAATPGLLCMACGVRLDLLEYERGEVLCTLTPHGLRLDRADRRTLISTDLLDAARAGPWTHATLDGDLLTLHADRPVTYRILGPHPTKHAHLMERTIQ